MKETSSCLESLTRVKVDLGILGQNIRALKGLTAPGTKFMAVVKANAYGHGAVPVARTALANKADFLAVARISEAVELRKVRITAPILLFGEIMPNQVSYLAEHDIRATITDLATAKALGAEAVRGKKPLKIHIKVDTGMGRLGLIQGQPGLDIPTPGLVEDIFAIGAIKGLAVEGMYTHLARADEKDKTHAMAQVRGFSRLIDLLAEKNSRPEIIHAANSAALIDLAESHFDMVRPGIAIYGLWPSDAVDQTRISLAPAMSIESRIIQIKSVPKGFGVSYGSTHVTPSPTRIATVPIGYADGYSRLLSNRGHMLVQGQKAPVIGRVCMDFTLIDIGHIPGAVVGEKVIIMGVQDKNAVLAEDIAKIMGTINYEVTAGLTARMPLSHLNSGTQLNE
ncbi:MAG: alanine racemase [Desulfobacter sp.]|nr:MAG: alanine racemase [Desulfobacter sp.]